MKDCISWSRSNEILFALLLSIFTLQKIVWSLCFPVPCVFAAFRGVCGYTIVKSLIYKNVPYWHTLHFIDLTPSLFDSSCRLPICLVCLKSASIFMRVVSNKPWKTCNLFKFSRDKTTSQDFIPHNLYTNIPVKLNVFFPRRGEKIRNSIPSCMCFA